MRRRFMSSSFLQCFFGVIVQVNVHPKPQHRRLIAFPVGQTGPKTKLGVVDQFRTVGLYQLLTVFQAARQSDHKTVAALGQVLQILLAVKATVHDKAGVLAVDEFIVGHHILEMCFVRNAAWIDTVVQRQTALLPIVHPHIDLGQLLFVPVIAPFQFPDVLTVGRNTRHVISQIFRLLFVLHPIPEEQLSTTVFSMRI